MFKDFTKYEVLEDGRIWSYSHNKFLKPSTNNVGYQRVALSDNEGKIKWYLLHRVIYEAVTGKPIPEGYDINHIDERKDNNAKSNLNLMSHKENVNWATGMLEHQKHKQIIQRFQNKLVLIKMEIWL